MTLITSFSYARLQFAQYHRLMAEVLRLYLSKEISLTRLAKCILALSIWTTCILCRGESPAFSVEHFAHQVWNTSNGLPQDTVRQFAQTRDGYLWIATDGGLVRFDGAEMTIFNRRTSPEMQSDLVNALLEDQAGNLWIATSNGLVERTSGHLRRYSKADGLPSDAILAVHQEVHGRLCAATSSGQACFEGGRFSSSPDEQVAPAPAVPSAQSSHGEVWQPSLHGLSRSTSDQTAEILLPEGFTGSDILCLFVDSEGNLWAGSANAGAVIIRSLPFATLGQKNGLASDQVRSILEGSRGDIWFGTSAGLTHLRDRAFDTISVKQGLASNAIIALAGTSIDNLWVGTPDGLSHIRGDQITTLTASDGLPDDNIRSLLQAQDHSLWIGTTHGLAHLSGGSRRDDSFSIQSYVMADGLASDVVGALLEDGSGGLWIGTRAGLSHLDHGKITSYGSRDGLLTPIITALARDRHGRLWVGTSGGGLYVMEGTRFLHVQAGSRDFPDTIYSILEDAESRIWLGSADGIYRVDFAGNLDAAGKNQAQPQMVRYDVADGLRINDCGSGGHPEAIRSKDGQLYFATSKGASVTDPEDVSLRRTPPQVVLENVLIDDVAANATGTLQVSAGHERIAFQYAGINFSAPSKVRYRYQLENFDRQWIDAGARRTAYYTNIPPGRYRFRVLASTDGATWSAAAAAIGLTMAPHYYQTWWFYSCVAMLLGLLAWKLYLYRLRQVELRFDAVLAERGRIAREIHDTLAQDIVAISVQLDLVSRLMTLSVDKARAQLVMTRDLVRRSLAEARSSIWDLRSPSSAANDLPTRLRDMTRQVLGSTPVVLDLQISGTYRPSARKLEDELLRIAQEAVTNVVRHANAARVEVLLDYHTQGVDLRVHDDGRGFAITDPQAGPPGHFGLRGMHERAQRAGASLIIDSNPGSGTTVLARAKFPAE